jgi:hypothetical protein
MFAAEHKGPQRHPVTGQVAAATQADKGDRLFFVSTEPRRFIELDLGPMSRSRQNLEAPQKSCRTFLARRRWMNSEGRQCPNLNAVAMRFAARHQRKSDECLELVARAENRLQNHQRWPNRTTCKTNQNTGGHVPQIKKGRASSR